MNDLTTVSRKEHKNDPMIAVPPRRMLNQTKWQLMIKLNRGTIVGGRV